MKGFGEPFDVIHGEKNSPLGAVLSDWSLRHFCLQINDRSAYIIHSTLINQYKVANAKTIALAKDGLCWRLHRGVNRRTPRERVASWLSVKLKRTPKSITLGGTWFQGSHDPADVAGICAAYVKGEQERRPQCRGDRWRRNAADDAVCAGQERGAIGHPGDA